MACLGAGMMKLKSHKHTHTQTYAHIPSGPVRDATLYIYTQNRRVLDLMRTLVSSRVTITSFVPRVRSATCGSYTVFIK